MVTSAKRETERIEAPSQSMARIWARWATESLFMSAYMKFLLQCQALNID